MKTNAQLQQDVVDELKWQPSIREAEIGVAAKDGVITLTGFVDSFAQKLTVEHAGERVSGVGCGERGVGSPRRELRRRPARRRCLIAARGRRAPCALS